MKTALGKGLESLLPDKSEDLLNIDISRIIPGKQQPRKAFKDNALAELAASIKEKGILQPILVSRTGDGAFRIIAGERRWRAAALVGLKKIPARIKNTTSEADELELGLIENLQREDLSPIETADGFNRLMKEFNLTQEDISTKVGKERATVANYLRLLKLPDEIKTFVNDSALSMGHARAILSIEGKANQIEAARKIIRKGFSVRESEELVKYWDSGKQAKAKTQGKKDPQIAALEEKLIRSLGTKARILHKGKKGKIEIEYYSLDELDRLLELLIP